MRNPIRSLVHGALLCVLAFTVTNCGGKKPHGPIVPSAPDARTAVALVRSGDSSAVYVDAAIPSGGGGAPGIEGSEQFVRGGAALLLLQVPEDATTAFIGVQGLRGHFRLNLPPSTAGVAHAMADRKRAASMRSSLLAVGARMVPLVLEPVSTVDSFDVEVSTRGPAGNSSVARHTMTASSAQEGTLQVSLSWTAPVDMDLHLVTPTGSEIFYGALSDGSGGQLDLDSNAGCYIDGVNNENITWTGTAAAAGDYIARVDLWAACELPGPFPYVVTIRRCGQTETLSGEFAAGDADHGGSGAGRTIRSFSNTAPIRSVDFWIKAFIPSSISGYTTTVPSGSYSGKTVIPHPVLDYYYLTDQRGFSSIPAASARMTSSLHIDLSGPVPSMSETETCGGTVELKGSTWAASCTSTAPTSRMHFTNLHRNGDLVTADVVGAAANPCSNAATYIAGDIDYEGTVSVDLARSTVSFNGKVDEFPWFEAYASINGGAAQMIFTQASAAGATASSLVGSANVAVSGSAAARCDASGPIPLAARGGLEHRPWSGARSKITYR